MSLYNDILVFLLLNNNEITTIGSHDCKQPHIPSPYYDYILGLCHQAVGHVRDAQQTLVHAGHESLQSFHRGNPSRF